MKPEESRARMEKILARLGLLEIMLKRPMTGDERRAVVLVLTAYEFFPELIPELEEALEPASEVVDEAWVSVDVADRKIDFDLLRELWEKTEEAALRKSFQKIQEAARARLATKARRG